MHYNASSGNEGPQLNSLRFQGSECRGDVEKKANF